MACRRVECNSATAAILILHSRSSWRGWRLAGKKEETGGKEGSKGGGRVGKEDWERREWKRNKRKEWMMEREREREY